jgi:hypothetical protein
MAHVLREPLDFQERRRKFTLAIKLAGFFDESGKFHDHDIVAFCGFLANSEQWNALQIVWDELLIRWGISSLHMSGGVLNFKRSLSARAPALGKEARIKVISQFIRAIRESLPIGIAAAVHVQAYQALPEHHKKVLGGDDPYYFAFSQAMGEVVGYLNVIPGSTANIICDDEEKYFVECYKMMARYKRNNRLLRDKFVSLCAANDAAFPQLQAADVFAYIIREEAGRLFLGVDHGWSEELFGAFERTSVPEHKFVLSPASGFWNAETLRLCAEDIFKSTKAKNAKKK